MSKKVSVIIPFFNVEKYIKKCIMSLLFQDYDNFDVILIDDKGSDRSREKVDELIKKYPDKLRLLENEENMGQGRSRMKAVYDTDADYIMFVDSDDYVAPDYISTFVKNAEPDYDMVIAGFTKDINGSYKKFDISDSAYTLLIYPVACCKMYRKKFLLDGNIDFSDSRKGEDIYFSLATFYNRPKYKIIKYYGYYYRLNQTSTTRSMNYDTDFETIVIEMFRRFRETFDMSKMNNKMKKAVEYTYAANIVNSLVTYGHGARWQKMREKRDRIEKDIKENYPDIMSNDLLRLLKPRSVSLKIRYGVGTFYWSRRLKVYNILLWIISWI